MHYCLFIVLEKTLEAISRNVLLPYLWSFPHFIRNAL